MKRTFSVGVIFCAVLFGMGTFSAHATVKNWTNSLGGSWFDSSGWSPNGVPLATDDVVITNNGTYTVYAPTGTVALTSFTLGGASGQQTFVYGTTVSQFDPANGVVQADGILTITNIGITGKWLVQPGGELRLATSSVMHLYELALTNLGTVTWSSGIIEVGGNNSDITYITNNGLWQMTGDFNMSSGGGGFSQFFNSGTVQKTAGTGTGTTSFGIQLHNLPSGVVNVTSGTLQLAAAGTNILGGSFTATSPGIMSFFGNMTDAGGVASGTGSLQFNGNFYLQTNTIPGITLSEGSIFITGTNTFQNAGAITNLTLDGATLQGSNRITGTLNVNEGSLGSYLLVTPGGQLNLSAGSFAILMYGLTLVNQGTVNWSGSGLNVGNVSPPTVVSNGGTWNILSNANVNNGGGGASFFTNAGLVLKTNSTGTSQLVPFTFVNLPSGVVRVASGELQMAQNYTNVAGEIQLAGGTFSAGFSGTLHMTGGTLDGAGSVGSAAAFDGGTVAPQPLIQFKSSLSLGTNTILSLAGTGSVPGVTYDQLSVLGSVAISNSTLQVTSLPSVAVGTAFVIVTNAFNGAATTGSFNGLPENALLTAGAQPFRVHYSGGNGNDVILVRDSGVNVSALLSSAGYSNTVYRLNGTGNPSTIYTVQASTNLLQWTNIGFSTGDVGGSFKFTDTNAHLFRYRLYRTTN